MITQKSSGLVDLSDLFGTEQTILAKNEGLNDTGSMKIRSARRILDDAHLLPGQTVIESTSGNMGVALAAECYSRRLNCILVVDPKLSPWHEQQMELYDAKIICVDEVDETGGWLKTRLAKVKAILSQNTNYFWVNQYSNPSNPLAFEELGEELYKAAREEIEKARRVILYMAVSTGGSLTGVVRGLRKHMPEKLRVVAVDAIGSAIFGQKPRKRFLNGIGSSLVDPPNLNKDLINWANFVSDKQAFLMCHVLSRNDIWVGGSSGAVVAAILKEQYSYRFDDLILTVFPDSADAYRDTIYSSKWMARHFREFTE